MPFLSLEGSSLLVTGASSGLGRAIAVAAAAEGARVALLARDEARLEETKELLEGTGHVVLRQDVRDLQGLGESVRDAARALGGLRGVVHAAGIQRTAPLRNLNFEDTRDLLDINVTSAFVVANAFRHRQVRLPGASLVFISSVLGLVGQSGVSAYSASKGALLSLTRSLSLELVRDGIRVNSICPGVVETEMTQRFSETLGRESFERVAAAHPLGLGKPEDIANAALFLLSPVSRWITGTALTVDGGYTAQ